MNVGQFEVYMEFPKYSYVGYDDEGNIIESECAEQDFGGDTYGHVVEIDGEQVANFGDDYHDKGYEKCQGFIIGYLVAKGMTFNEASQFLTENVVYNCRVNFMEYGYGH